MNKLTVFALLFSFTLTACDLPVVSQIQPGISTQQHVESQYRNSTEIDLSHGESLKVATPTVIQQPVYSTSNDNQLSNNTYYTNSANQQIHSPAYSSTVPAGASAQCGDRTYSFSVSRRGTCSHHGGVINWL